MAHHTCVLYGDLVPSEDCEACYPTDPAPPALEADAEKCPSPEGRHYIRNVAADTDPPKWVCVRCSYVVPDFAPPDADAEKAWTDDPFTHVDGRDLTDDEESAAHAGHILGYQRGYAAGRRSRDGELELLCAETSSLLRCEPIPHSKEGQYLHLLECSGDRRQPPGSGICVCKIAPRGQLAAAQEEIGRLKEALEDTPEGPNKRADAWRRSYKQAERDLAAARAETERVIGILAEGVRVVSNGPHGQVEEWLHRAALATEREREKK